MARALRDMADFGLPLRDAAEADWASLPSRFLLRSLSNAASMDLRNVSTFPCLMSLIRTRCTFFNCPDLCALAYCQKTLTLF